MEKKRLLAFATGAALRFRGAAAFSPIKTGTSRMSWQNHAPSSKSFQLSSSTTDDDNEPLFSQTPEEVYADLTSATDSTAVGLDDLDDDNEPLFSQTPEEVYAELTSAIDSTVVGLEDLGRWIELQELVEDEMILPSEVEAFYDAAVPSQDALGLDAAAFAKFYTLIDDLFEDDVDEAQESLAPEDSNVDGEANAEAVAGTTVTLEDLLSAISAIDDEPLTVLPCGLDCEDSTREEISELIAQLRQSDANLVKRNGGVVEAQSLLGIWSLLYTSSLTMIINKSLSGLGRSTSDTANFSGLTRTLSGTKYFGECRFTETIDAGDDDGTSIEVVVDGEWELKDGADPDTGERVTILKADPITLEYPGNKAKADDWSSLGSIKFLDIICLIDDIMLLRGITLTGEESLFVWKKVSQ